ncbi:MAG TPA: NAD-dependent epimerase/dehydratase family protein [Candidatus Eremiobacteraceae bacterium]|nr:NAD-dependent epimerase/dehydratase family protein [Candidatus Eremiobacteraceae bacterium]
MNVLIIGGSNFLGPHVIDALLRRDHRVTAFNRGRNPSQSRPGVEHVVGDRATDLERLRGRKFDAVVDTCGYFPRIVALSVEMLAPAIASYVFVSSISVYVDPIEPPRDEKSELATIADPTIEEITPESYGPLKALCEKAVIDGADGRALVVRPGLIVGPLDPTDRFTYWPHRAALGGEMLVPGEPGHNISFIDVRDLAEFIAGSVERGTSGVFNASGDTTKSTMGDLIESCLRLSDTRTKATWVDEQFVKAEEIAPWSELPAWIPTGEDTLMWASSAKAVAAGLAYRPLDETVRATLEYTRAKGLDRALKSGLTRDREAELLARWHNREEKAM